MQKIRVLLADDHTIVRQGLRSLLEAQPDISVVGEANTGRQAIQMAGKFLPDVLVMDIAMPVLNGIEATRRICRENPQTKVLVLSAYCDEEYTRKVTEAGAAGYLVKHTAAIDLVDAVREISKGNAYFSPGIARSLAEQCRRISMGFGQERKRYVNLTSREAEVLQLIAEGRANKQIATELGISIKTVEKHRQGLMDKLGIHDIAGLTRYAIAKGIIETNSDLRLK